MVFKPLMSTLLRITMGWVGSRVTNWTSVALQLISWISKYLDRRPLVVLGWLTHINPAGGVVLSLGQVRSTGQQPWLVHLSATLLHYVVIIISNVPDRLTDSLRTHTLTTSKWQRAKQMPIWTAFTVTTLLTRRALSSDIWLDICHPCRKYSIERLTLFPHAPQLSLSAWKSVQLPSQQSGVGALHYCWREEVSDISFASNRQYERETYNTTTCATVVVVC